ncbi:RagB/SusD family nutrient uptake outer membrane protein [Aestuariivivens sediminis]|uniref:RagB/SusD family nutrient uptake outer membrane protein n=1 Tax=Aestuariivivens sediminis TaxID=2913557 RepID=UPI001F590807|nr:RagB/SusD family nutrient uptake outer membrane protein [Aestuariivivens sediminis]
MKILSIKLLSICLVVLLGLSSCANDLDLFPTNEIQGDELFVSVEAYKQGLSTVYQNLSGFDGSGVYRYYWTLQESGTDEMASKWDGGQQTTQLIWSSDHNMSAERYREILYLVSLCNNFILEASPDVLQKRGFSEADKAEVEIYLSEVRFVRAYAYWMLLDLFGNPTFATEVTLANGDTPSQIKQGDLFEFIESELQDIELNMVEARSNEYGRADRAAVWSLLARLYLNAEIYSGEAHFTEAISYSKKVIDAGYALEQKHAWLMLGDNHLNTNEFIFTFNYDNEFGNPWRSTNVNILGPAGVPPSITGLTASWEGLRVRSEIPALFPSYDPSIDKRAVFWTDNQTLEIESLLNPRHGYSIYKFRNVDRNGVPILQKNTNNSASDVDFPVFRLAEIYFIYAEAVLRGGTGGDIAIALSYINRIRGRAYGDNPDSTLGNISLSDLTLDFILDERARELLWEGHRRTDLIRYNRFTTADYLWEWKGGVKSGTSVDSKYNLFPIPISDLLTNPNLKQNPGY